MIENGYAFDFDGETERKRSIRINGMNNIFYCRYQSSNFGEKN